MMASTARPVVTVVETLMLSNGKSPVRINHRPSKIIPRFLPAKLFVNAISSPLSPRSCDGAEHNASCSAVSVEFASLIDHSSFSHGGAAADMDNVRFAAHQARLGRHGPQIIHFDFQRGV